MHSVLAYSPDETMVVVLSLVLTLLSWAWWYSDLHAVSALRSTPDVRHVLSLAPVAALLVVLAVLKTAASFDVRDSGPYLFQYAAMGAAWIGVGARSFRWLGLSPRDDVAERGNAAAAVALAGACLGLALCYAGGNIGDGPGWWVVVFASGIATAGFLVAWGLLEKLAHPSDGITIDRDLAAGLRFAGFAVGEGLVLGRAAAGDWISAEDTLGDFALLGWPALLLLALAVLLERALVPSAEQPRRSPFACGLLPGALLLGLALGWVVAHGSGA
jgi:uncharacterized membrane protein YjfL (UPF0719 family)